MIAILEDDVERAAEMRTVLAEIVADAQIEDGADVVIHDSASAMNAWLADHIDSCVLISLDHDLGPSRDGVDPGIGRAVADFLATRRPSCPVIVHSSNATAAIGMFMALQSSGWNVLRVIPFDTHAWVRAAWAPAISRRAALTRRVVDG